jgi:hypothetical protein
MNSMEAPYKFHTEVKRRKKKENRRKRRRKKKLSPPPKNWILDPPLRRGVQAGEQPGW